MIIKLPAGYDVSHWKEIPNFKLVDPKPMLFITKATEAAPNTGYAGHTDGKFLRFAEGMMQIDCTRGFYHFNRKSVDGRKQAEHFLNIISKCHILSSDLLILDVEEGGEKASQLWIWFELVRIAYPDNPLLLYSRANILNPIALTPGEKEYFRKIPTWPAGYPFFPDFFTTIPKGYIPDQSKWGPSVLWQYSEGGKVSGIIGDVDLNLITPEFQAILESRKTVMGELIPMNATGKCINSNNKVWSSIGGQVIGAFRVNDPVTIDQEQVASGVKYVHVFNSTLRGWSKAFWFTYSEAPTEPPPTTPTTGPTLKHTVEVFDDGSLKVDGNSIP